MLCDASEKKTFFPFFFNKQVHMYVDLTTMFYFKASEFIQKVASSKEIANIDCWQP